MSFPEAILFDLDGTLINTEVYYQRSYFQAAQELGYPLSKEQCLTLRSLDRRLADVYFQKLFGDPNAGETLRKRRDELMIGTPVEAKPGAHTLALELKKRGIPYCVCSASPMETIRRNLAKAGLEEDFQTYYSARDVAHGKPAPDIYISTCAELGFDPRNALAVEDTPNGFESAYDAGLNVIFCVDLTEPDEFIQTHAYRIIRALDEIIPLLP